MISAKARGRPNSADENHASRGAVAQAPVVAVATIGNTMPQPASTRWLSRFSTRPRSDPAASVTPNQRAAGSQPTVPSSPTAQEAMII